MRELSLTRRFAGKLPAVADGFYAELPAIDAFGDVADLARYRPAPDSWFIIVTDVRGSTKAIEAGRYKDVNVVGAASIVAARNAAGDTEIPFVFGGDGATILVPGTLVPHVSTALREVQARSSDAFGLPLRLGIVSIRALREDGFPVLVGKHAISEHVTLALLAGTGVSEAERRIKEDEANHSIEEGPASASFEGFECRWQPLQAQRGEVLTLLVRSSDHDPDAQSATYRKVIEGVEAILSGDGRPVSDGNLQLARDGNVFDAEATLQSGATSGLAFWSRKTKARALTAIGRFLLARKMDALGFPGSVYRQQVVQNTDFRKFDDMLRMVLDVSAEQRAQILEMLESMSGVVFGHHSASAALMTCVIRQHDQDHFHFVDGADGGYAMAAKKLKAQLE